jgi:predicted RecB family nuclease
MQGDVVVHRSLWADSREDEEKIWKEFVELLSTIDNPVLIHYGSYETTFIKTMCNRYGVSWDSKLPSIQSCEVSENSQLSSEINVSQIAKKKQGLKS